MLVTVWRRRKQEVQRLKFVKKIIFVSTLMSGEQIIIIQIIHKLVKVNSLTYLGGTKNGDYSWTHVVLFLHSVFEEANRINMLSQNF